MAPLLFTKQSQAVYILSATTMATLCLLSPTLPDGHNSKSNLLILGSKFVSMIHWLDAQASGIRQMPSNVLIDPALQHNEASCLLFRGFQESVPHELAHLRVCLFSNVCFTVVSCYSEGVAGRPHCEGKKKLLDLLDASGAKRVLAFKTCYARACIHACVPSCMCGRCSRAQIRIRIWGATDLPKRLFKSTFLDDNFSE